MARAVVIGGTGLIGRAVARRLVADGWEVVVTGRDVSHLPPDLRVADVRFAAADRDDAAALRAAIGPGADLLVDNICYTAAQAELLLPGMRDAGSAVVMSSRAVYADAAGRHGNSDEPPQFDGPITEDQPTVAPRSDVHYDTREGYAANKVAAENVLLTSGLPVSVLRPGKVHGEAANPPREWVWVKRALDRRPVVLLADGGRWPVRPSAAVNIAALVATCAATPGRRVLNAGDPDVVTTLEISRTVAGHLGHDREEVLLDRTAPVGLGETPWDGTVNTPLDISASLALGYQPVGDYSSTVVAEIDWLTGLAVTGAMGASLPPELDSAHFEGQFDYASEDRYLAAQPR